MQIKTDKYIRNVKKNNIESYFIWRFRTFFIALVGILYSRFVIFSFGFYCFSWASFSWCLKWTMYFMAAIAINMFTMTEQQMHDSNELRPRTFFPILSTFLQLLFFRSFFNAWKSFLHFSYSVLCSQHFMGHIKRWAVDFLLLWFFFSITNFSGEKGEFFIQE